MATQVKIFDADFSDSIAKLKADLKETRKLFEAAKPNTQEFQNYSAEIKRLDGTIKSLNGVTKEQVNALGGINQATKFASGSYGELKQKIEQQKKALLDLNVESEDFARTQEGLITLQNQRIEIEKKIPSLFQERIKGAIDESNSLKQLKIDLREAQSAALNGDGKAAERVAELKDKIDDLKDSTQSLQGSGVERLNTSMNLLTEGFSNFDADKIKTGFKGIGAAMSAIPIILIIEGIKALIDNFDAVVEFTKELFGVIDDGAVKVADLTREIEYQELANIGLISSLENGIALMEAQGVASDKIIKKKKELVDIEIEANKKKIESNKQTIENIKKETSTYDQLKVATLAVLGFSAKASEVAVAASKEKADKILQINQDIAKSEADNAKLVNSLAIDQAKIDKDNANAKKEKQKKERELWREQDEFVKEIIKGWEEDDQKLADERIANIDRVAKANEAAWQKEVDESDAKYKKQQQLGVINAELEVYRVQEQGGNLLKAKLDLLTAERDQELKEGEKTNEEKLLIAAKYQADYNAILDESKQREFQAAEDLTKSLIATSDLYFTFKRSSLKKGSDEDKKAAEQQFNINKALAIAQTIVNTAAAITASIANTTLPYPASLAGPISIGAVGTAQTAAIAAQKFQYFEGGYTESGDPREESYSIGNKQFHKDEYVIPSRVLNTEKGSLLASYAEGLRMGTTNNFKHIGGFFDGGFASRSASASPTSNANFQNKLFDFITSMPTPVVRVTDINNVNTRLNKSINVSSI